MHYKNGTEAHEGDYVIYPQPFRGTVVAGQIYHLNPGTETCNSMLAVTKPGGVDWYHVNIKDCISADDAYDYYFKYENLSK